MVIVIFAEGAQGRRPERSRGGGTRFSQAKKAGSSRLKPFGEQTSVLPKLSADQPLRRQKLVLSDLALIDWLQLPELPPRAWPASLRLRPELSSHSPRAEALDLPA